MRISDWSSDVCSSDLGGVTLPGIGLALMRNCAGAVGAYRILAVERGKTIYVAQGYAAYASALDLGLRSVMAGRIVPGRVDIATVGTNDAGYARDRKSTRLNSSH